jgi:hypothetical protein
MASKFEIYKNKSGELRWRPIRKAKASLVWEISSGKYNVTSLVAQ